MINRTLRLSIAIAAILALLAVAAGCGGSSSDTEDSGGTAAEISSGGGSAAFLKPGSPTNNLVKFGTEAPASEREAAAAVLAKSLKAREEADFAVQCTTLSQALIEELAAPKKGAAAEKACPSELEQLAAPLPQTQSVRVDNLSGGGEVAALRVKGKEGNALYHGNDKKDYAASMTKDGLTWKMAALLTTELNPPEQAPSAPPAQTKSGN